MKQTSLRSLHESIGGRLTAFAGWEMPLQYDGVISEHMAVRSAAGMFDVSHLGRMRIEGPGSTALLRQQLCNDISSIDTGRAQYTMALNESGGVEDDIIVWRLDDEEYWVLPNGANFDEIVTRFADAATSEIRVDPVQDTTVLIAVQGPDAISAIETVVGSAPGRFRTLATEFDGQPLWCAGTGYTGERGAELAVPLATGPALFEALLDHGVTPCGLGARDTLRLEKGYPLWGQDLDATTTPLEAGLDWVVDWDHDFVGRAALAWQRSEGISRQLTAFQLATRRVPRHGSVMTAGASTGTVASGNFSPVLEVGIGMGYLTPPSEVSQIEIAIRNESHTAERIDLPFV